MILVDFLVCMTNQMMNQTNLNFWFIDQVKFQLMHLIGIELLFDISNENFISSRFPNFLVAGINRFRQTMAISFLYIVR